MADKRSMIKELIFTILLLLSTSVQADAPPVVLEDGKEFYEIGLNLDILEDPSGKLTIDDVNNPKWATKFKRSSKKVPNFGFSKSVFWARVRILNKRRDNEFWFISQNYFTQDYLTFFKNINGRWKSYATGDSTPFKTREIEDKSFNFITCIFDF